MNASPSTHHLSGSRRPLCPALALRERVACSRVPVRVPVRVLVLEPVPVPDLVPDLVPVPAPAVVLVPPASDSSPPHAAEGPGRSRKARAQQRERYAMGTHDKVGAVDTRRRHVRLPPVLPILALALSRVGVRLLRQMAGAGQRRAPKRTGAHRRTATQLPKGGLPSGSAPPAIPHPAGLTRRRQVLVRDRPCAIPTPKPRLLLSRPTRARLHGALRLGRLLVPTLRPACRRRCTRILHKPVSIRSHRFGSRRCLMPVACGARKVGEALS
eukprot:scaffold744_cov240-Pinguiococcus_pyrenoidosus.AAC.14